MASDQPVRPELADQETLLQYLYPRAQMNESANPRAFAIYMDTSVPVSVTVDGLQPNTEYLIFVHIETLHQVGPLNCTIHVQMITSVFHVSLSKEHNYIFAG